MKIKYIIVLLILMIQSVGLKAQESDDIILKAMKDELSRNLGSLKLEGIEKPFYISYLVLTGKSYIIQASLGSIIKSVSSSVGQGEVKVLVGNYHVNNQNFVGSRWEWSNVPRPEFPVVADYFGYRSELWQITDYVYKENGEKLAKKLSAMKQQVLTDQDTIPDDFLKSEAVKKYEKQPTIAFNTNQWDQRIREISSIFINFPQIIESKVSLAYYPVSVYYSNSEGTEAIYPYSYFDIKVQASVMTNDGEKFYDDYEILTHFPEESGDIEKLKTEILKFAEELCQLTKAPILAEDYSGPVLIENDAAAEIFVTKFFADYKGLYSNKLPICMDEGTKSAKRDELKSLEVKLKRRILPTSFTVISKPALSNYTGNILAGNYQLDAEGIAPKEIALVENGILVNLLTDRTPTLKFKESSGNSRISFNSFNFTRKAPGVIVVQTSEGKSTKTLKKLLLQTAKKEGLDYALIIRKTAPKQNNNFYSDGSSDKLNLELVYVYKVDVKTGIETLVKGIEIQDVPFSAFKNIIAASSKDYIHNMFIYNYSRYFEDNPLSGIPVSIILPQSILFEELELSKKDMSGSEKPPVVANPVK